MKVAVVEARPEAKMAISNLKSKTFEVRQEVVRDTTVARPDQVVARSAVRNLTGSLAKDGTLDWDVPEGDWTIVRIGYKCNGRRNHPASDHGVGLEVDKLSASAMDYHFEQYVARLCRTLGPLAGKVKHGFNNILVDSYEVGCQNWTQGLEREFAKRRGYGMTPYYPVMAGVVVGSVRDSERFLYDFRKTVSELFCENFAGRLAARCHERGMKLILEPYGNCPCDDLDFGKYADVPQCEFWSWFEKKGDFCTDVGNARVPAYLAHYWGRKHVGAEAFTADGGMGGRWRTTPFRIKSQGDRAFAEGVPLIERCITVDGDCIAEPANFLAPVGTTVSHLINCAGGLCRKPKKIVMGAPLTGHAAWDAETPVTKNTRAVVVLSDFFDRESKDPAVCLRCGRCIDACPMGLMPVKIMEAYRRMDTKACEALGADACMECGCCTYVCPGGVPVAQTVSAARAKVSEKRRKAAEADVK